MRPVIGAGGGECWGAQGWRSDGSRQAGAAGRWA